MKKLVIDTTTKLVTDGLEDILDTNQYVGEIVETSSVLETTIAPSGSYVFDNGGKGIKTLKVISDVPFTFSYTSQMNTYNFGANFKEISIVCNGASDGATADWIAKNGEVTIANVSAEDTAHIKIIYTH